MNKIFLYSRPCLRLKSTKLFFSTNAGAAASSLRERLAAIANDNVNGSTIAETNVDDGKLVQSAFEKYFNQTNSPISSIHNIRSGSHVDISAADIEKYIPEGLAGDLKEEFTFTQNQQHWMIRDSTKVVVRLIEEWEKQLKGTTKSADNRNNKALESVINVENLTDRKEWGDSTLQCYSFGNNLITDEVLKLAKSDDSQPGFIALNSKNSIVNQTIKNIKNKFNGKLPSKILLGGELLIPF